MRRVLRVASLGALALPLAFGCSGAQDGALPLQALTMRPGQASPLDQIQTDAHKLESLVRSTFTKRFLAASLALEHVAPRKLFSDAAREHFWTEKQASALPIAERLKLREIVADEELYYNSRYGSPLSYARALDLLDESGVALGARTRLLDFGYGYVGHLRMLALLGLDVTGVDVDPMLPALYGEPGDQGEIKNDGVTGRLRLVDGSFPGDAATRTALGGGFDVILSKNVLKKGYIHPDRPIDARDRIDLGVSDELALKAFFDALAPGGVMLVYNIGPATTPKDKPLAAASDGRSPFTRDQWTAAGFQVVCFDQDDTKAIRDLGSALGWGDDPDDKWDLDHDLAVLFTLVKKPLS